MKIPTLKLNEKEVQNNIELNDSLLKNQNAPELLLFLKSLFFSSSGPKVKS
jgi:hypothetical protein